MTITKNSDTLKIVKKGKDLTVRKGRACHRHIQKKLHSPQGGKSGKMKINGIGTVKKEEAMKILTAEGRRAVKAREISTEELGEMYKLEMVKRASQFKRNQELFWVNYNRIPKEIADKLSPEDIANLVDAFYQCYGDGKTGGERC